MTFGMPQEEREKPVDVLILGTKRDAIVGIWRPLKRKLKEDGHSVRTTSSTLLVLDHIKSGTVGVVISAEEIQIVDGLKFPGWFSQETSYPPPYFLIGEELTKREVRKHPNAKFITGFFKRPINAEVLGKKVSEHLALRKEQIANVPNGIKGLQKSTEHLNRIH